MHKTDYESFIFTDEKEKSAVMGAVERYPIKKADYILDDRTITPLTDPAFVLLSSIFLGELSL